MKTSIAAIALFAAASAAHAQTTSQFVPSSQPQNVLQLSASGTVEVVQDLLMLQLTTTREGSDATAVQNQLKTALDAALTEARKQALPGQLDVRTGNFALYPRNTRDGKISGWQGVAELVLEGRDFPRITQTASRISTMTLGGVSFGLSREQRAKVETEAQDIAISRFRAKASELAKGFGFSGYTLREVSVNANEPGFPRPMLARASMAGAEVQKMADVPVEAGKANVTVNVSGSVQLR